MSASLTTENTELTENSTEKNNSVEAHVIGQIQLESAIQHYNEGNYICAITLARAAEEYLGKLLKHSTDKKSSMRILQNNILDESGKKPDLNFIANNLKHFDPNFCEETHHIKLDAIQLICRALTNFISLEIPISTIMMEFSKNHDPSKIDRIIDSALFPVNSVSSVVKNTEEDLNTISGKIINCALNVHKQLGAGLLESAYQHGLAYMMAKEGLKFSREKVIPIMIDNHKLDEGYRADFIVENKIIIETKSVENLNSNHEAQILNYMRLGNFPIGLLMNFNETLLKNGLKRFKI